MIFLGIGAGNLVKNTGIVTSIGPSPIWQSNDPNGYACSASGCRGQGLSDLLFHQLQTALNNTNAALSRLYRQTGVAYPDPQLAVNGVLDKDTTASLDQIVMTNMVPGLSMHLDSAGIAANAASLTSSMNAWLSTQKTDSGGTGPCNPLIDKNCVGPRGGGTITTPPTCDPAVDKNCLVNVNGSAPGRNNGGPQPTIYYCDDGSKVTDPRQCVVQTPPAVYVCWDGTQVSDPSACPMPPPPPSGGSSVSPPAPTPVTVTVTTAPDGSAVVNTAPAPTVAPIDATPRLFGFPRNWVIGGAAVAGGLLGIVLGVLAFKKAH